MNDLIKNLNELIDSGTKLYEFNEKNQRIQVIEGLEISNDKTDVLVCSYKVDFDEKANEFLKSEKFTNALFKPKTRGIILIDIAGYSKGNTLYQAAVLSIFNQAIKHVIITLKLFSKGEVIEQIIPTGDGCYIVFNEGINDRFFRTVLMINSEMYVLQNRILDKFGKDKGKYDKLHIRMGCTLNEIDFIIDAAGNRNCYGIGMNEAARVLSYGQEKVKIKFKDEALDSIFFDQTVYDQAKLFIDSLKGIEPDIELVELGDLSDKHGITRKIWRIKNLPKYLGFSLHSPEELAAP